jgi:hypothetical protein
MRDAAALFWAFLDFALAWIAYAGRWLRGVLEGAGVPPALQTVLLVAVAVLLGVGMLRAVSGLLRLLLVAAAGLLLARALGAI